jgi:hypothetical protein
MELSLKTLYPAYYSYNTDWNGQSIPQTGTRNMQQVCESWALTAFDGSQSADVFIKERPSLVELGFRKRGEQVAAANASLPETMAKFAGTRGFDAKFWREQNATFNKSFTDNIDELNTRFRQAGCKLHYHNGFIQMSTDALTVQQVEEPFWALVADPKWANVDTDLKEAIDRRENGGRDPAVYAAHALESTIKIISGEKGWNTGNEKGAKNYIDNLGASKNGGFITRWEADALERFFTNVRNPLGHGPGQDPRPELTPQQTDCAIETAMMWIKSLIRRL